MNRHQPSLICALFGMGHLMSGVEPWYVDAFLDRGAKRKEPRLHLAQFGGVAEMMAHADTVERPSSICWPGFLNRPSTLTLVGKIAMGQSPFTGLHLHDITRAFTAMLRPKDRAWGRLGALEQIAITDRFWLSDSVIFPNQPFDTLPLVRDVLADPSRTTTLPLEAMRDAFDALPEERKPSARFLPVFAHETDGSASAHMRITLLHDAMLHVGEAMAITTHARRSSRGMPSSIVPTPAWAGPLHLPR